MTEATQFVTLGIDKETFAVPVEIVREILDMQPVARLPHAPPYLLGMIDVRGCSVPVVDLRVKLGLPPAPATAATRILVLEVAVGARASPMGIVADRVFEVAALDGRTLEPPPDIGERWNSDYITGVGRRGDGFVVVIDVRRLFQDREASRIAPSEPPLAPAA